MCQNRFSKISIICPECHPHSTIVCFVSQWGPTYPWGPGSWQQARHQTAFFRILCLIISQSLKVRELWPECFCKTSTLGCPSRWTFKVTLQGQQHDPDTRCWFIQWVIEESFLDFFLYKKGFVKTVRVIENWLKLDRPNFWTKIAVKIGTSNLETNFLGMKALILSPI